MSIMTDQTKITEGGIPQCAHQDIMLTQLSFLLIDGIPAYQDIKLQALYYNVQHEPNKYNNLFFLHIQYIIQDSSMQVEMIESN